MPMGEILRVGQVVEDRLIRTVKGEQRVAKLFQKERKEGRTAGGKDTLPELVMTRARAKTKEGEQ